MDYYEEFGVARTATPAQIHLAYKALVRLLHPDQIQDAELKRLAEAQLKRVNEIYAVLDDARRRRSYDLSLAAGLTQLAGGPPDEAQPPPAPLYTRFRGYAGWIVAALIALSWSVTTLSHPSPTPAPAVSVASAGPRQPPSMPLPDTGGRVQNARPPQTPSHRPSATLEAAPPRESVVVPEPPPEPVLHPALPLASAVPPPAPAPADPPPPPSPDPQPKGLAGRWYYPQKPGAAAKDLYPPEYIETVISELDGILRGRYRARYRVANQAIPPEVAFDFQGLAREGSATLLWTAAGGARGHVILKLLSRDSLEVNWYASELGRNLGLASGTAILIRRRDP